MAPLTNWQIIFDYCCPECGEVPDESNFSEETQTGFCLTCQETMTYERVMDPAERAADYAASYEWRDVA